MKVKFLVLCMTFLMFEAGCSDADDTIPQDPLEGIWHLKNVSGGIQGIDVDYDQGDVIWNFTLDQNTLKVETIFFSTGPKSIYQGLSSGTYAVGFEEKDTTRTILLDGIKFRVFEINKSKTLVLDDGVAADGFIRSFVR